MAAIDPPGLDEKKKKVPIPKAKPTGPEVFWERAKRAKAARTKAAEQRAITRSRAGRDTGIGAGVATAPPKNLLKKDEPELRPWEGGVRYLDLPEWLGGGRIKIDSSDKAMNSSYPGDEYRNKGGRLKKSVKNAKAKPHKAKAKTRKVAQKQKQKPRGVGVACNGFGKAMYV